MTTLLDSSAAFDKISWKRIKDQLVKRRVPAASIKLTMTQLFSNKISVCRTSTIFPKRWRGVKQGGILSGYLFSACYDELVDNLKITCAGIL